MSNYIYNPDSGELYHYGVKGMKWGVRKDPYAARRVRGHAGPGIYIGNKRKLQGYKKDLEYLDNGGHLSVGLTKKRQAAYDARDRRALEKGIAKAEAKEAKKHAKKADLADRKSREKERKELIKEYGKLEDQYTYGKHPNRSKNAMLDKRMGEIDDRLSKLDEADLNMIKNGRHEGERIMGRVGHKTMGVVSGMATVHLGASAVNSFSKGDFMGGAVYGAGAALAISSSEAHRRADQKLKRH